MLPIPLPSPEHDPFPLFPQTLLLFRVTIGTGTCDWPQRLLTLYPKCSRLHHSRALPRHPQNRQIFQQFSLLRQWNLCFEVRPVSIPLALVRSALKLPDSVLDPPLNAWTESAPEASEVDEKFEEGEVDEHEESRGGEDEDEAEEIDVSVEARQSS